MPAAQREFRLCRRSNNKINTLPTSACVCSARAAATEMSHPMTWQPKEETSDPWRTSRTLPGPNKHTNSLSITSELLRGAGATQSAMRAEQYPVSSKQGRDRLYLQVLARVHDWQITLRWCKTASNACRASTARTACNLERARSKQNTCESFARSLRSSSVRLHQKDKQTDRNLSVHNCR